MNSGEKIHLALTNAPAATLLLTFYDFLLRFVSRHFLISFFREKEDLLEK
jgi:hypothetical protein